MGVRGHFNAHHPVHILLPQLLPLNQILADVHCLLPQAIARRGSFLDLFGRVADHVELPLLPAELLQLWDRGLVWGHPIVVLGPAPASEHLEEGGLFHLRLPLHHYCVAIDRLIQHRAAPETFAEGALPDSRFQGEVRCAGLAHHLQDVVHDLLRLELVHRAGKRQVPYFLLWLSLIDLAFLGKGRNPAFVVGAH